jgi:hypothetical protein
VVVVVAPVGPVIEVLLNRYLFTAFVGRPLYLYTVLPTFGGSGSLLSPLSAPLDGEASRLVSALKQHRRHARAVQCVNHRCLQTAEGNAKARRD